MDAELFLTTWLTLLTSMGLLMCHPTTWRSTYPPLFQPGPQFCPDTGRTVCAAVDYYPTDRIYNLLTSARSQVFNLTSLFVDERKGDTEPNTSQLIIHPPYYQNRDGYGPNQPPPGGRFSPAGRTDRNRSGRNSQNRSNESPSYWTQSNRWRQVPPSSRHPSPGGQNGAPGQPSLDQYNSRGQNLQRPDPWRHSNNNNNQPQLQQHNQPIRTDDDNANRGIGEGSPQQRIPAEHNYGPNPAWRGQQQEVNNYNRQNPGPDQFYQTQTPNIAQNNNKGQPLYRNIGQRELTDFDFTWNGPPGDQPHYNREEYNENSDFRTAEPKFQNSVKRGKRNQDVEVACPVQSTFVPPRAALNDQSQWKYIVNVPERDQRFSQVVRVDVCMTEGQACSSRLSLPFGFESRCRQKYIKKKLLSLNPDGQGTGEDNFFIPSCCVCEIVRAGNK